MRRRLAVRCLVALVALVAATTVAAALLGEAQPPGHDRSTFSFRAEGFRGFYEVLRSLGYRTERHTSSYGALPAPAQTVLVSIDPLPPRVLSGEHDAHLDAAQARAVERWVSAGGNLVVAWPGRAVRRLFGVELEQEARSVSGDEGHPLRALFGGDVPATSWARAAGKLSGAAELASISDVLPEVAPAAAAKAPAFLRGGEDGSGPVELSVFDGPLAERFSVSVSLEGRPLALTAAVGEGRVWLVSSSFPFTNLGIGALRTGRLVAAIADRASDGGQRAILLDEYCHGIRARRGLFEGILSTSLSYPVAAMALLAALLGWRGAVRLGPPRAERTVPRRAKEEFVVSLADIGLRARRHKAAARRIVETYRSKLPGGGRGGPEAAELERMLEEIERAANYGVRELAATARDAERACGQWSRR